MRAGEGALTADDGSVKGQYTCKCVDLPSGERLCDPIDCELLSNYQI